MSIQKLILSVIGTISGMVLLVTPIHAQISDAERIYEEGVYQLEATGNFEEAIRLFNQVVSDFPSNKEVAAKALLKKGFCYERLGSQKASEAYEQIINQYPDQVGMVTQARERLSALHKDETNGLTMSRLVPPDIYIECQVLSPDGTKVACIGWDTGQNIAVYDLETGELKYITDYQWDGKSCVTYAPVWSPDSREVVYWVSCWGEPEKDNPELMITSMDGESKILFQNDEAGAAAACDWLPDKSAVLAIIGNKDRVSKLVLISVADGSLKEICPLQSNYGMKDAIMAEASGAADLSPDGRFIVLSDEKAPGNHDIYIVSANGGEKHILLDHPADEIQPLWSPDGSYIAFKSNRHGSWALWGVKVNNSQVDGEPFMILEGMQDAELASWTTSGICTRTMLSTSDIYTLEIDPATNEVLSKPHLLDTKAFGTSIYPLWSPDGKYLSFKSYNVADKINYLMIMPSGGGEPDKYNPKFSITPVGGTFQWLPSGSGIGIVYWDKDTNFYFGNLDPVSGEWETKQVPAGDFNGHLMQVAWSADGKSFYFSYVNGEDLEIKIVNHDLETGKEHVLYHYAMGEGENWNWWNLRTSRDISRLAFHMKDKLCIMDIESGHLHQIDYTPEKSFYAPTWSPDGKYLLVKGPHEKGEELNELYIVSVADGSYQCLNVSQYLPKGARIMTCPDWSMDGKTIVFDTRMWKSEANLIRNVIQ